MNIGQSVIKGCLALVTIILFQVRCSYFPRKPNSFNHLSIIRQLSLISNGDILFDSLAKVNVTESSLTAKFLEENVLYFREVPTVVLESTGDISVLHRQEKTTLATELLKGVRKS